MNDLIAAPFIMDDPFEDLHTKAVRTGHLTTYPNLVQGSAEWLAIRRGILTASEMKLIMTPTLKAASNDKSRAHVFEMLAQRITGYAEPTFVSDDMLRGQIDEADARNLYSEHFAPVDEVGFFVSDALGFPIGYSPDGAVGSDGLIEIKSRRQKFQVETILGGTMPIDYLLQVQTGLMVTGREWLDFISYSAGLPMCRVRIYPDRQIQDAIAEAATEFEAKVGELLTEYQARLERDKTLIPTTRTEQEYI